MSLKTSADVLIGGKIYTLSGYESEEYLQRVANYINNKLNEFDEVERFRRLPADMKSTLLELNIADDYFKAKDQAEKLEEDLREKEKEIYELQHDLISAKIRVESSEKAAADLEKENRELLLNKSRLESSLEDALLGRVKGQAPVSGEQEEKDKDKDKDIDGLQSQEENGKGRKDRKATEKKDDKERVAQKE